MHQKDRTDQSLRSGSAHRPAREPVHRATARLHPHSKACLYLHMLQLAWSTRLAPFQHGLSERRGRRSNQAQRGATLTKASSPAETERDFSTCGATVTPLRLHLRHHCCTSLMPSTLGVDQGYVRHLFLLTCLKGQLKASTWIKR